MVSCSAYGCTNRHNPDLNISFHTFPLKDKDLLAKWLQAVRRKGFKPTIYSTLCSVHFEEEDFILRPGKTKPRLRKDAVPSIFTYRNNLPEYHQPNHKAPSSEEELAPASPSFIEVESISVAKREIGTQTLEDNSYELLTTLRRKVKRYQQRSRRREVKIRSMKKSMESKGILNSYFEKLLVKYSDYW